MGLKCNFWYISIMRHFSVGPDSVSASLQPIPEGRGVRVAYDDTGSQVHEVHGNTGTNVITTRHFRTMELESAPVITTRVLTTRDIARDREPLPQNLPIRALNREGSFSETSFKPREGDTPTHRRHPCERTSLANADQESASCCSGCCRHGASPSLRERSPQHEVVARPRDGDSARGSTTRPSSHHVHSHSRPAYPPVPCTHPGCTHPGCTHPGCTHPGCTPSNNTVYPPRPSAHTPCVCGQPNRVGTHATTVRTHPTGVCTHPECMQPAASPLVQPAHACAHSTVCTHTHSAVCMHPCACPQAAAVICTQPATCTHTTTCTQPTTCAHFQIHARPGTQPQIKEETTVSKSVAKPERPGVCCQCPCNVEESIGSEADVVSEVSFRAPSRTVTTTHTVTQSRPATCRGCHHVCPSQKQTHCKETREKETRERETYSASNNRACKCDRRCRCEQVCRCDRACRCARVCRCERVCTCAKARSKSVCTHKHTAVPENDCPTVYVATEGDTTHVCAFLHADVRTRRPAETHRHKRVDTVKETTSHGCKGDNDNCTCTYFHKRLGGHA